MGVKPYPFKSPEPPPRSFSIIETEVVKTVCDLFLDAYFKDPLGSMGLNEPGYGALTREIMAVADASCEGKAVFALEGGYYLPGLEQSIVSTLEVMIDPSSGEESFEPASQAKFDKQAKPLIAAIRETHSRFWKSLSQ